MTNCKFTTKLKDIIADTACLAVDARQLLSTEMENVPKPDQAKEIRTNIELAYRNLEDAMFRFDNALQYKNAKCQNAQK